MKYDESVHGNDGITWTQMKQLFQQHAKRKAYRKHFYFCPEIQFRAKQVYDIKGKLKLIDQIFSSW